MKYLAILIACLALPALTFAEEAGHEGHNHEGHTHAEHAEAAPVEAAPAEAPEAEATTQPAAAKVPTIITPKDRISYAIGLDIGRQMASVFLPEDLNPKYLAEGMDDMINRRQPQLTNEEIQTAMMSLQMKLMARQQQKQQQQPKADPELAAKNLEAGNTFLADNAAKEGVVTTESGLQYKVITEGTGATPTATDTVVTHYRGTLIDGTEFDSSYGRGEPISFPVGGVIAGWTEALKLMKVGAKWELYIPANLAYGEMGSPPVIGPNATLIFEIELIDIKQ